MINVKWRGSEVKREKALGQEEDGEKGSIMDGERR